MEEGSAPRGGKGMRSMVGLADEPRATTTASPAPSQTVQHSVSLTTHKLTHCAMSYAKVKGTATPQVCVWADFRYTPN